MITCHSILNIFISITFLCHDKKPDAPTIKLLGSPQIDLEEGKDSLTLRCEADANPPASIVWRRAGRSEIASLSESLSLRPVGRRDSGLYSCQAQNSVGTSDQLSVQLDIKCKCCSQTVFHLIYSCKKLISICMNNNNAFSQYAKCNE